MKALLRVLTLGLLTLVPLTAARAQGPALSPISNLAVNAGTTRTVNVVAVDTEGRPVNVTAALPPFATLNTPTVGSGVVVTSISLAPSSAQVGDYTVAVTATAGGVSNVRVFQITVNAEASDQEPIVNTPPLTEVTAGVALTFIVNASDPDGDAIASLSAAGLPPGATLTPTGSNTARFDWTPLAEDAGEYDVLFTAANALSGTGVTHVRVAGPPTLTITPIDDVTVAGGASASVPVHASGVPGEPITLAASLPSFATLNPPGSGTSEVNTTVTVAPPTGSAGTYHASITAISNGFTFTEEFDIIVTGSSGGGNRPPVVTAPATATVAIGSTLSFQVTAIDPDGDHVDVMGSALPPGSMFTDHLNNTGTFSWTPVAGQSGTYTASFSGLDSQGGSGSASTLIYVTGDPDSNSAPVLNAPATANVDEGVHLSFTVTASDPDGDPIALSANDMPVGATYTDNGDNTLTFSWTPSSDQSGSYVVAFLGTDGNGGTGTASTTIAVRDVKPDGGGGGVVAGQACLIGKFKKHSDRTCFRIRPIKNSFDLRDVLLSSLRIRYKGDSLAALNGASIEVDCHRHDHDGRLGYDSRPADLAKGDRDDHDDDDHDDDRGKSCGLSCEDDRKHDDCKDRDHKCDTLGVRVCFSTKALIKLFEADNSAQFANTSSNRWHQPKLPCALKDAEILATLTNNKTVVATFGRRHDDKDDDDDDDGHGNAGSQTGNEIRAQVRPNPLAPHTELTFTTGSDGRVQVTVYDTQGRIVKRLMNDFRASGTQTVAWDGTNESQNRVPRGVYFLRIQTRETDTTRRVRVTN